VGAPVGVAVGRMAPVSEPRCGTAVTPARLRGPGPTPEGRQPPVANEEHTNRVQP